MITPPAALRPTAETDVFLIGLRRSGIHAVVSWLIPHFGGLTRLVNDPVFEADGADPLEGRPSRYYFSRRGRATEIVLGGNLPNVAEGIALDHGTAYARRFNPLVRPFVRQVLKGLKRFRRGQPAGAPLIPYAFETAEGVVVDTNLFVIENLTPDGFARVYPAWREKVYAPWLAERGLAPAPRTRVVMTLREPWNQLASLIKNPPTKPPRVIAPEAYQENWLDYALEFAGERDRLRAFGEVLPVSYPRWFRDPDYRAELAAALGVAPTDFGLDVVSNFNGGSSFDGQSLTGRAQQMKVGERWKAYADHPLMRELCGDPLVDTLCRKVFGTGSPLARKAA